MNRNKNIFEPMTWEQYSENRERYGHVSTWALYNEKVLNLEKTEAEYDFPLRKELIIANDENEFIEKKLSEKLNKNVIFLALNFSGPQSMEKAKNNKMHQILAKYNEKYNNDYLKNNMEESIEDQKERYKELSDLAKDDEMYLFANIYSPFGKGTKSYGYYNVMENNKKANELLSGAYITDLIKFAPTDKEIISCGISQADSTNKKVTDLLKKGYIEYQINGLRDELNTLGVTKPIFIYLHSKLKNNAILKKRLKELYGEDTGIYYLPHYSPQTKNIGGKIYDDYEQMFCKVTEKVLDEIENKYNK